MKVVILAGGFGTRLAEGPTAIPKPMVADRPAFLFSATLCSTMPRTLALGYKAEVVKNFVLQFADIASDLTIDLGAGTVERRRRQQECWKNPLHRYRPRSTHLPAAACVAWRRSSAMEPSCSPIATACPMCRSIACSSFIEAMAGSRTASRPSGVPLTIKQGGIKIGMAQEACGVVPRSDGWTSPRGQSMRTDQERFRHDYGKVRTTAQRTRPLAPGSFSPAPA